MKSRLPAPKERAKQARRMSQNFHDMASENAAIDDAALRGATGYVTAPIVSAGVGAVVLWWRGSELTLWNVLSIAGAVGIVAVSAWLRARRGGAIRR